MECSSLAFVSVVGSPISDEGGFVVLIVVDNVAARFFVEGILIVLLLSESLQNLLGILFLYHSFAAFLSDADSPTRDLGLGGIAMPARSSRFSHFLWDCTRRRRRNASRRLGGELSGDSSVMVVAACVVVQGLGSGGSLLTIA